MAMLGPIKTDYRELTMFIQSGDGPVVLQGIKSSRFKPLLNNEGNLMLCSCLLLQVTSLQLTASQ